MGIPKVRYVVSAEAEDESLDMISEMCLMAAAGYEKKEVGKDLPTADLKHQLTSLSQLSVL